MSTAEFETLQTQGGLLSLEYLHTIARLGAPSQQADKYQVPADLEMHSEISCAWTIGRALSEESSKGIINGKQFALKFLADVLGFEGIRPVREAAQASEEHGPTHLAQNDAVAIVIAPSDVGLDRRQDGLLAGRKITPFNLAQIHLNNSEEHLWGIAADGATLRLLRDSTSMTQAAFIEADLRRMLQEGGEGHYSDFRALFLLAHASRFQPDDNNSCILEQWREESIQTGIRAHEHLRNGVEKALESLGTGLLHHAANNSLQAAFPQSGSAHAFYQELLWLAYRLIFLLVTEDRGLIQKPEANEQQKMVYSRGYSMSRLRERATRPDIADDFDDLWESLKRTFAALQGGSHHLALPALGGLFDEDKCPNITNCRLSNRFLLGTVYHLSYFKQGNVTQRVNYRDMGADELGSIYESLLELTPRRNTQNIFSFFNPGDEEGSGHDRRASGSYYTSPSLVDELVKSALQPVLAKIRYGQDLLNLRVVDPACGSGHFLIAAARKMAAKLVELREMEADRLGTGSMHTVTSQRQALRAVISNCICGVDKNPMALNLAKIALWLEAFDGSKALAFLDHHLQCGDSLLGVLDLDLLKKGIPDEAYKAVADDDKDICSSLRKNNKYERDNPSIANLFATHQLDLAAEASRIEAMPDDDLVQIAAKRQAQQVLEVKQSSTGVQVAADMYVSAFLMRKRPDAPTPPTSADVFAALAGTGPPDSAVADAARQCAEKNGFFHWWLRYQAVGESGGFDVVLANPPWGRAKLQEREFFSRRVPKIANAPNANIRKQLIAQLGNEENDVAGCIAKREYAIALHTSKTLKKYYLKSCNYPLTGKGDVNSYALFSELCLELSRSGRVGIIVPTGISTDDTTKDFFAHLIENGILHSLYDFENRLGLFPAVHRMFRFCLLTIAKCERADSVCLAQTVADLRDLRRRITLTREQFELVNPNTLNMPLYRTAEDRKLTEKIYRSASILWRNIAGDGDEVNHWQLKFLRMFEMSGDSNLFNIKDDQATVRLYEAKYFHRYDHRFSSHDHHTDDISQEEKQNPSFLIKTRYAISKIIMLARVGSALGTIPAKLRKAAENGESNANIVVCNWLAGNSEAIMEEHHTARLPGFLRAYVDQIDLDAASKYAREVPLSMDAMSQLLRALNLTDLLQMRTPKWFLGWRDITSSQNEFTLISTILPRAAIGHTILVAHSRLSATRISMLQAIWNSLLMNFVAAQKMAGSHFNYEIMKQLPILHPDEFTEEDLRAIVPLVLELNYTAYDLKPFYDDIVAKDSAYDTRPKSEQGKPYNWNEVRRAYLRAQIDARIALKYNITRDELRYILDPTDVMGAGYPSETFRILQQREEEAHGKFRTRRLVLEAYDKLTQSK